MLNIPQLFTKYKPLLTKCYLFYCRWQYIIPKTNKLSRKKKKKSVSIFSRWNRIPTKSTYLSCRKWFRCEGRAESCEWLRLQYRSTRRGWWSGQLPQGHSHETCQPSIGIHSHHRSHGISYSLDDEDSSSHLQQRCKELIFSIEFLSFTFLQLTT